MKQSKIVSFSEQILNVGSGFLISLLYWQFAIVYQLNAIDELTFSTNLFITIQFTVISVIRGYVWRRVFNHDKFSVWMENKLGGNVV